MNAMGHDVPTMIGVEHADLAQKIDKLIPDYMAMGERGMGDMAQMSMPLPANTAPMMTGEGPFGSVEMGGMFSVVKVRRNQKPGDFSNPAWFKHPAGTTAYEFTSTAPEAPLSPATTGQSMPRKKVDAEEVDVKIRKPTAHCDH